MIITPNSSHFSKETRGFTLIELLVAMSIFIVLTGVLIVQRPTARSGLETTNVAYDVALFLREAQTFGLGTLGSGSNFDVGYGVHMARSDLSRLILFVDNNKNGTYDGASEFLEEYTFPDKVSLFQYCGVHPSGTTNCGDASGGIQGINIAFIRPDPDAKISLHPGSAQFEQASIHLLHDRGDTSTVSVFHTGQISVSP